MSYVIDMLRLEKAEQAATAQIIFEQTRGDLNKIKQMVDDPTNVELAVAGLAKLEPAAAGPKVNCLVVSLCALLLIPA